MAKALTLSEYFHENRALIQECLSVTCVFPVSAGAKLLIDLRPLCPEEKGYLTAHYDRKGRQVIGFVPAHEVNVGEWVNMNDAPPVIPRKELPKSADIRAARMARRYGLDYEVWGLPSWPFGVSTLCHHFSLHSEYHVPAARDPLAFQPWPYDVIATPGASPMSCMVLPEDTVLRVPQWKKGRSVIDKETFFASQVLYRDEAAPGGYNISAQDYAWRGLRRAA